MFVHHLSECLISEITDRLEIKSVIGNLHRKLSAYLVVS
jgi:hypothetical protein